MPIPGNSLSGKKFAITGAGRGLGAALAIVMADAGARLVLLARDAAALAETANAIRGRSGQIAGTLTCDLADAASCAQAGQALAAQHADLDGLVHNGAMWLPGPVSGTGDADIQACIASAAIGTLILTRHLVPVLAARPAADIHIVVSTSGLPNAALSGTSIAFRAAKAAQDGIVQGLSEELRGTNIRVTAVYPDDFTNISPLAPAWTATRRPGDALTNREVIDSILFILTMPRNATIRTLVIA